MTTTVAHLRVRMPRGRLRVAIWILLMISPCIRTDAAGDRVCRAISKWVCRGLKVEAATERR